MPLLPLLVPWPIHISGLWRRIIACGLTGLAALAVDKSPRNMLTASVAWFQPRFPSPYWRRFAPGRICPLLQEKPMGKLMDKRGHAGRRCRGVHNPPLIAACWASRGKRAPAAKCKHPHPCYPRANPFIHRLHRKAVKRCRCQHWTSAGTRHPVESADWLCGATHSNAIKRLNPACQCRCSRCAGRRDPGWALSAPAREATTWTQSTPSGVLSVPRMQARLVRQRAKIHGSICPYRQHVSMHTLSPGMAPPTPWGGILSGACYSKGMIQPSALRHRRGNRPCL